MHGTEGSERVSPRCATLDDFEWKAIKILQLKRNSYLSLRKFKLGGLPIRFMKGTKVFLPQKGTFGDIDFKLVLKKLLKSSERTLTLSLPA